MLNYLYISAICGGFSATLLTSIILVITKKYHGSLTMDYTDGVQKFHTAPTPRIGGIALAVGFFTSWLFLEGDAKNLWGMICLAGIPALAFGLAEDVTGKVSVKWRLLGTIASGLIFALLTGYTITKIDVFGIDTLLSITAISFLFTAFAIGGVANAINIIDGFHGLAAGTLILILSAFALAAWRVGDMEFCAVAITMAAIMAGFLLVNFPLGKLFLGDAGAYFAGYIVAVMAVMLPARNAEISPWVSLLILAYPVTETIVSIIRKTLSEGHHPGQPDNQHLHQLIYKSWIEKITSGLGVPAAKNPLTGMFMWTLPLLSLTYVAYCGFKSSEVIWYFVLSVAVYLHFYRSSLAQESRIAQPS